MKYLIIVIYNKIKYVWLMTFSQRKLIVNNFLIQHNIRIFGSNFIHLLMIRSGSKPSIERGGYV